MLATTNIQNVCKKSLNMYILSFHIGSIAHEFSIIWYSIQNKKWERTSHKLWCIVSMPGHQWPMSPFKIYLWVVCMPSYFLHRKQCVASTCFFLGMCSLKETIFFLEESPAFAFPWLPSLLVCREGLLIHLGASKLPYTLGHCCSSEFILVLPFSWDHSQNVTCQVHAIKWFHKLGYSVGVV